MTDFVQRPAESPLSWLKRLESQDEGPLAPGDRRARAAYLAEARRLLEEERQRAKWGRAQR
jgi:hypothetical protein